MSNFLGKCDIFETNATFFDENVVFLSNCNFFNYNANFSSKIPGFFMYMFNFLGKWHIFKTNATFFYENVIFQSKCYILDVNVQHRKMATFSFKIIKMQHFSSKMLFRLKCSIFQENATFSRCKFNILCSKMLFSDQHAAFYIVNTTHFLSKCNIFDSQMLCSFLIKMLHFRIT